MTTPSPKRLRRRYVGPLSAVLVVLPTGRQLTVNRGDDVEVLAVEAEALDRLPDWEVPSPDSSKED